MGERKKRKKKEGVFHSTIWKIVFSIIVLVMPLNIITMLLVQEVLDSDRAQVIEELQNTLDVSRVNLEYDLKNASRKALYLSLQNVDFIRAKEGMRGLDDMEKGQTISEIRSRVQELKEDYRTVDLVYFYFPLSENTVMYGYPGISNTAVDEVIRQRSEEDAGSYGTSWRVQEIEGSCFLVSHASWHNAEFGVLVNLERTMQRLNFSGNREERWLFFADKEETVFSGEGRQLMEEKQLSWEELRGQGDYEVLTAASDNYGFHLIEVIEGFGIAGNLSVTMQILEGLAILFAVLAIPLLLIIIQRWVTNPLNKLTKAMQQIERGNLEYRIEGGTGSREFERINQNFNAMMEQVRELKIDVYEKQLEKDNVRMLYLSQQIQPHFILNAMNILYSYEPEEYELSRKMILCISKYFRYIAYANVSFVTLEQEMDHIKNYFEIQKARFPDLFFSIVEYEQELAEAMIPPLLVQNFAENAIKHSLKVGEKVTIFLVTEYYPGDRSKMRIRIADTGKGVSDEVLDSIRRFQETGEWQKNLGIGIQNSIERLKYLYDQDTSIHFGRDENYRGTNVEIVLPVFYETGNAET